MVSELKRKSIKITYDKSLEQECSIGVSKIGGKPDLPKDFEWFYYEGESPNNVVKNRPLAFLAQINCEEASKFDSDKLLPTKGMLYFFFTRLFHKIGDLTQSIKVVVKFSILMVMNQSFTEQNTRQIWIYPMTLGQTNHCRKRQLHFLKK